VCNIGLRCDIRLQNVLHFVVHGIHIVYVARGVTSAILHKMANLAAIEAWPFGSGAAVILQWLGGSRTVVGVVFLLRAHGIGVGIVALILSMVVGCSGARYIHGHWDIVVHRSWGIGGIVGQPLLLLLLLLWPHLLAVAPATQLELVPVLTECVIERSQVWESLSGPDELNHLFPFCDVDGLFFVLVVGCGE
jgi:hypothetical protein